MAQELIEWKKDFEDKDPMTTIIDKWMAYVRQGNTMGDAATLAQKLNDGMVSCIDRAIQEIVPKVLIGVSNRNIRG